MHGDQTEQFAALLQKLNIDPQQNNSLEDYVEATMNAAVEEAKPSRGQPGQQAADLVNDLDKKWIFYFDVTEQAKTGSQTVQSFEDNLSVVGQFETLQAFWQYWASFEVEKLKEGANLRLFHSGIKPVWEDPANKEGGKWVARGLEPKDRNRIWPTIVLAIVQGMLRDDFNEHVCGVVLSCKTGGDCIQVWCGNAFDPKTAEDKVTVGSILQKLVCPEQSTRFLYQSHAGKKRVGPSPAQIEKAKSASVKKEEVRMWLTAINLEEYFDDFIADGYDDMRSIVALDEPDLADMGFKKGHKKRFLAARDKYLETHQEIGARAKVRETKMAELAKEGNWRDQPMKKAVAHDRTSHDTYTTPLAGKGDAGHGHGGGGTQPGTKRMDSMPLTTSATLLQAAAQQQPRAQSVPVQPTTTLNPMQQLQYLAQLQQLQQSGMLAAANPWQFAFGAVPNMAAGFGSPFGGSGNFAALTPASSMEWPSGPTGHLKSRGSGSAHAHANAASASSPSPSAPTSTSSSTGPAKSSTFKLNPQAAAFTPSRPPPPPPPPTPPPPSSPPPEDGDDDSFDEDGKKDSRDAKSGREWREADAIAADDPDRDKMEDRIAIELTPEAQAVVHQAYPLPNEDWQPVGKFIFIRHSRPPAGLELGDTMELKLAGVGRNQGLLALRFEGVGFDIGSPHAVIYKATCTRQEESNLITAWEEPEEAFLLKGVVKRVCRLKPPKRTNNNRKKQAAAKRGAGRGFDAMPMLGLQPPIPFMFDPAALQQAQAQPPYFYTNPPDLLQQLLATGMMAP